MFGGWFDSSLLTLADYQEVVLNQVRDALATILQFREALVRIVSIFFHMVKDAIFIRITSITSACQSHPGAITSEMLSG